MTIFSSKTNKLITTTAITLISTALLSGTAFADSQEDLELRIRKIGRLNITQPVPAPKPVTTTASAPSTNSVAVAPTPSVNAAIDGEALYTAKCLACHASGVLNAPILGNTEQWSARIAQGPETLYSHAIDGFNTMPAKGGAADLSDKQIKAIVDFMVSKAQ